MTIIAAAVKYGELICHVPAPGRHHNVLHAVYGIRESLTEEAKEEFEKKIEGFLDCSGNFLNRKEAYIHAKECCQPWFRSTNSKHYQGDELYSEDVWESGDKFISPFTKNLNKINWIDYEYSGRNY